jgi:hypothetical protein
MTTVLSVPKNEPVIPDCCNIGVIFRVLAGVSVVVLLGLASRGDGWALVLENFIEASMLIEAIYVLVAAMPIHMPPQSGYSGWPAY